MLQLNQSQFWWTVVSTVLIVLGTVLPYACEQITGSVNDLCRYGAAACLVTGFIGLLFALCHGGDSTCWVLGGLGAAMMLGAGLACVFGCHNDSTMPEWCKWLAIPAVLGLVLLAMAAGRNGGSGGWLAGAAVAFLVIGCCMMKYQRKNSVVDGLGGPMIGMGWVFLAMAGAAQSM